MKKALSTFLFLFLFVPSGLFALSDSGAYLNFDQKLSAVRTNDNLQLSLMVNSGKLTVNAFEAIINIPNSLEVISADYDNSICQYFIYQPKIVGNKVDFKCGLPHGYFGTSGKLVNFRLKAVSAGTSFLSVSNARVLASDGLGTNVLSGQNTAQIDIAEAAAPIIIQKVDPTLTPSGDITINHPSQLTPPAINTVAVAANVEMTITGLVEKNVARVQTNWELGYALSIDEMVFLVSAKY